MAAIAQRKHVIAAEREIVEAGGVAAPSRHFNVLGAYDVHGGAHLNAALAERAFDERDFQLDGRARREIAWGKEIDAARADIARDQRDRE